MKKFPIHEVAEFLRLFCKSAGMPLFNPKDRACVITRSHANYGKAYSAMLEWEGSPPHFCLYYSCGVIVVDGRKIHWQRADKARAILNRFLAAYPANEDESPVWIGTRWRYRP